MVWWLVFVGAIALAFGIALYRTRGTWGPDPRSWKDGTPESNAMTWMSRKGRWPSRY